MGELIDGRWREGGLENEMEEGALKRPPSVYRHVVIPRGEPLAKGGCVAEAGRYHLYVSLACPWASRALVMRRLKGLEEVIGLSITHWHMGEDGWSFEAGDGVVPDTINDATFVRDLCALDDPRCTTRATVPILWDKKTDRIVSNESSEIIRMFNSAFDTVGPRPGDYYPEDLRGEIDSVNDRIYPTLNNGVYRAGMATRQGAYDEALGEVFATLDWLEERLATRRYLVGGTLTEADVRLFTTLVRFDLVYHYHFRCNLRPLTDYPAVWGYTRDLFQHPDFRGTVDFGHIKRHYFGSHPWINPSGIVPAGPIRDFDAPTDRAELTG